MPGVTRPSLAVAPLLAAVTTANVAPLIPPPGIAIPQALNKPPAIIPAIPGQPVVIPPPTVVTPTAVGQTVVSAFNNFSKNILELKIDNKMCIINKNYLIACTSGNSRSISSSNLT